MTGAFYQARENEHHQDEENKAAQRWNSHKNFLDELGRIHPPEGHTHDARNVQSKMYN